MAKQPKATPSKRAPKKKATKGKAPYAKSVASRKKHKQSRSFPYYADQNDQGLGGRFVITIEGKTSSDVFDDHTTVDPAEHYDDVTQTNQIGAWDVVDYKASNNGKKLTIVFTALDHSPPRRLHPGLGSGTGNIVITTTDPDTSTELPGPSSGIFVHPVTIDPCS